MAVARRLHSGHSTTQLSGGGCTWKCRKSCGENSTGGTRAPRRVAARRLAKRNIAGVGYCTAECPPPAPGRLPAMEFLGLEAARRRQIRDRGAAAFGAGRTASVADGQYAHSVSRRVDGYGRTELPLYSRQPESSRRAMANEAESCRTFTEDHVAAVPCRASLIDSRGDSLLPGRRMSAARIR